MDDLLRGAIERHLDAVLEEKVLDSALTMFTKGLSPMVKSKEDVLIGYVFGRMIQFAFSATQVYYRRNPTEDEFAEMGEILTRRAMEIKSKVTLVANR